MTHYVHVFTALPPICGHLRTVDFKNIFKLIFAFSYNIAQVSILQPKYIVTRGCYTRFKVKIGLPEKGNKATSTQTCGPLVQRPQKPDSIKKVSQFKENRGTRKST